jgi:peptidoglycan hydrolase-like protein with peptidoglycan-binding domain
VAIARHPREFVGIVLTGLATVVIFINALFLQHGPHPAPIFATRAPVVAVPTAAQPAQQNPAQNRERVIAEIQRQLARRGFYEGAIDGVWGAKTDVATRDFLAAGGLKLNPDAGDELLRALSASNVTARAGPSAPAADPIVALLAPSTRVLAIQRALSDYGYGQIKPTGVVDPATKAAIEKFEHARRLPVDGQVSGALVHELAAMTGRPLE